MYTKLSTMATKTTKSLHGNRKNMTEKVHMTA